jgi:transcriptional regulator with XRE-family HTH domain
VAITVSLDQLGAALRRRRGEERQTLRDIEERTGISAATLSRIERGHRPDTAVIKKLAEWLGVNVYAAGDESSEIRTDEDLKNQIAVHLRANKKLSEDVAHAIVQAFDVIMAHEIRKAGKQGPISP